MAIVLSTTSGIECECAMSASAARSATTPPGLEQFGEDRLRPVRHRPPNGVEVVHVNERRRPAEPLEHVAKLGQRAAVQLSRSDDMVAGLEQRVEREELRRVPGGHGNRAATALEGEERPSPRAPRPSGS